MGVVHLARRGDGPRVALKVLRPHIIGDDEIRARLAREVNSLSRIRSPRVAEIVDADPWGGIPYVATRYVPGLALHDYVTEEGPIHGADLVHLALTLAEGLTAVHACGVLHRDVKPANVLMEGRSPVLIDFGLARVADDPKLTHSGWLMGTPGYLAPEILHGQEATTASDVHSWAATVAFAGLGGPPFGRGPSMAIMDRVRRGEHDLSGLPPRLRELLGACLDPEPNRRPTVPQLVQALQGPQTVREPEQRAADPFTMPMAAAARLETEAPTQHGSDQYPTRPRPAQGYEPAAETVVETVDEPRPTRPVIQHVQPMVRSGSEPASFALRVRRGSLVVGLGLAAGGLVAAYPVIGASLLLIVAWLLRSGSLAGSAAGNRRLMRGRKWYDHGQTLVAAPWHLLQSIPGTLGLGLWSAGVAFAGGLLGYAVAASAPIVMGVAGVMLAGSLGIGPGGGRVRNPLRRLINLLAAPPLLWFLTLVMLLVLAGLSGSFAQTGPDWLPFDQGPFGLFS